MSAAIESLISSGTKLWLDSIDPDLVARNLALGATGATSNPIIVADLLKTGRFDKAINGLIGDGLSDADIAWAMTDQLVQEAQSAFLPIWEETGGNDGYVSFELDPLLEDPQLDLPKQKRVSRYIELGEVWSRGHVSRMMKVPATPAGLASLEELAAAGITLNVTLIFTSDQYRQARESVWRGAQRHGSLERFKSVYSLFVSRIDVFTAKHVPELSPAAQGQVGIVNAKQIWRENNEFWRDKNLPLDQEIIFASTGTKDPTDAPWKYAEALAGSDIQTNPPATNEAISNSDVSFSNQVAVPPRPELLREIEQRVDFVKMQTVLMEEGIEKFASPQRSLLSLIASNRAVLSQDDPSAPATVSADDST